MNLLRALFAVLVLSLLASPLFAADAPQRQTLEKAIPYAISLLEAKDYKGFLTNFMAPYELKEKTESQSLDELAKSFGKKRSADMLKALNAIKGLTPKIEADGSIATYELPGKGIIGNKQVSFIRIRNNWYISD